MKTVFIFLLFIVIIKLSTGQSYFAPLGATWYYTHSQFSSITDFNKLIVVDTSVYINGKYCSKISKTISNCSPEYEYVYFENNVVFKLNQETNVFDTLYNFNLNAGEGWGTIIIDSVVYVNINGTILKGLYVNGNTFGGPILERIGGPFSFISDNPACDPIDGGYRRCYYDSILGLCNFTSYPCDTIFNSVPMNSNETNLSVYPQPASSYLNIISNKLINNLSIYNLIGKELFIIKSINNNIIDMPIDLQDGIYVLKIVTYEHNIILKKLIIKN